MTILVPCESGKIATYFASLVLKTATEGVGDLVVTAMWLRLFMAKPWGERSRDWLKGRRKPTNRPSGEK